MPGFLYISQLLSFIYRMLNNPHQLFNLLLAGRQLINLPKRLHNLRPGRRCSFPCLQYMTAGIIRMSTGVTLLKPAGS